MDIKERVLIGMVFLGLVLLSLWLHGLLAKSNEQITAVEENNPDYYIEKFTATGADQSGGKYQLIADRMVHYPIGDRASLDNPHIIQYDSTEDDSAKAPRHIYAQSGWLYNNQSTVLLTGNVRVIQSQSGGADDASNVMSVQKMVIHLKK